MILQPYSRGAFATVSVPGSKSITNRALLLAALARGASKLTGVLHSDDTEVMLTALGQLGCDVEINGNEAVVDSTHFGSVNGGEISIGNAGTATRFLTAALGLTHGKWRLHGKQRMHQRPIGDLINALEQIGVDVYQ